VGRALVKQAQRLFHLWHQFQQGAFSRRALESLMRPIEQRVHRLLLQARRCAALTRTAKRLLKREPALWTFEQVPSVEPTNNFPERLLRHGVLWRKSSGGTRSAAGSRFVERILSVVMSLRLQHRAVLPWLIQALRAFRRGQAPPSFLPEPTL
jgi:transposase